MPIALEKLRAVTAIVTHGGGCPDGIASAVLLKDAIPHAEVRFVSYGTKEHDELVAAPGMLFCDFSPPRDRWGEFLEAGALVLDHHKTAKEIVQTFAVRWQGVFADEAEEPGVSGAVLAFREVWDPVSRHSAEMSALTGEHLYARATRDFAELAGVRDTWQKDHPRWREACVQAEMLRFYGEDLVGEDLFRDDVLGVYMQTGERLLKNHEAAVLRAVSESYRVQVRRKTSYAERPTELDVVVLPNVATTSDAAELVDADIAAGFRYAADGDGLKLHFSLRSRARAGVQFDCGAFAKLHGGGGHTGAAGFTLEGDRVWNGGTPYDALRQLLVDWTDGEDIP